MSGTIVDCTTSKTSDAVSLYRRTMGRLAGGVAVILSGTREAPVGMTVNSLVSVSLNPLLLLFCARLHSATAAAIARSEVFSVNILTEGQIRASVHFSGKHADFDTADLQARDEHIWMKDNAGTMLCRVERIHRAGDHDIIIGRVDDVIAGSELPAPLIYHEGQYYSLGSACALPERGDSRALRLSVPDGYEGRP
ncbi:flavin reductase family protein [Bosea sp. 124]|uniref:flavin reductase family protein n=1 Tax=Bosea sp. 124 TaxID=2135642 RepID=UPI000D3F7CA1|nr:flavin reductase family protein [Bosea sp. 124]PTM41469.1 flavin reductase (DIM6/NTAB) family NADH-FMN oxidoreductase RutF [Bosea sp. 124]